MTLNDWLKKEGLTPTDLAKRMNKPQATVARHASGKRMPEPSFMSEYFQITGGLVTPNDFYGCGPQTNSAPQPEPAQ